MKTQDKLKVPDGVKQKTEEKFEQLHGALAVAQLDRQELKASRKTWEDIQSADQLIEKAKINLKTKTLK